MAQGTGGRGCPRRRRRRTGPTGRVDRGLAPDPATPQPRHRRQLAADGPGPVPGPPPQTAQALGEGELSAAHASVVAHGTSDLHEHVRAEADMVLVEAARRLDPPQLRRVTAHLRLVTDPDGADAAPSGAISGVGVADPNR